MTEITIERVNTGNFHEFADLVERLTDYEHLLPPDAAARERLRVDALAEPPKYEAYLGRVDGRAVGYITFFFTYSTFLARPTLYLEDIFVLEEERGRGVGKALFEYCRRVAGDRGCGRMEWMVLTWNEPAIRFYERCGGERLDWHIYRLDGENLTGRRSAASGT
ncbi:GNAT family N-acetyltransferase [Methanoculleus sp. FWC-SCC1]|uniref:GNAT family N-acetyltransferase n=1 Tax=Methanoculleus frigidifontis TaxID=2584085 RepID=A0ABT8MDQ4_9EURY|nr:GNAT family N-acetyltransferase [Methanoculleus sp. FWC-SCC1]MDN7026061.1 GNAT family N-acetyltransferase [Methanoculleus sp. FWC-SCC1]